jgi:hypothetical protein
MQQGIVSVAMALVSQRDAHRAASGYVAQSVGKSFHVDEPRFFEQSNLWSFFIQRHLPELNRPVVVGRIQVDARTGEVIPLTADEILDMQERALVLAARGRGDKLAYSADGFIVAYQAKIKASVYVSDQIAFFAGADGRPTWIAGDPPVWRVATVLRLRDRGKVADLGVVDVDACTGEVIPLTNSELQTRREQAEHAALTAQLSPATAG